jgi:hypothetical protein
MVVATIETNTRLEYVSLMKEAIQDQYIEVGKPVGDKDGLYLVELPAEADSGAWRVWVKHEDLLPSHLEAAE